MEKIYLIHGFNSKDNGLNSIDKMRPYLEKENFLVNDIDYGWMGFLGVRICNRRLAKVINTLLEPNKILVGHSNGCAISALACDLGYQPLGLVFIQPALNKNWIPPPQVPWVQVYANKSDTWAWLSKFLPNHIWGDMGTNGHDYYDQRVKSIDLGIGGHNGEFESPAIMQWIAEDIRERIDKDVDGK